MAFIAAVRAVHLVGHRGFKVTPPLLACKFDVSIMKATLQTDHTTIHYRTEDCVRLNCLSSILAESESRSKWLLLSVKASDFVKLH